MNNFHVGQKVVCVFAGCFPGTEGMKWYPAEAPIEGAIYTIRRVFVDCRGFRVVWLNEIARDQRARRYWGKNIGYSATRFRPLAERKTDISIFHEILRKASAPAVPAA